MAQDTTAVRADSVKHRQAPELARVTVRDRRPDARAYAAAASRTATKTLTPLRDVPQSATVLTHAFLADKSIEGMAEAVRYIPGITMASGESHEDAVVIRGNSSTADFFLDGIRDDGRFVRDLYNIERVEALKGSNAMIFGRGGAGGVINRVSKEAGFARRGEISVEGATYAHARSALDAGQSFGTVAARINGVVEHTDGFRDQGFVKRFGVNPTATVLTGSGALVRLSYEHFDDTRRIDRGIPSFGSGPSAAPITRFYGDGDLNHGFAHVDEANVLAEQPFGRVVLRNHAHWGSYNKFYQNVFPGGAQSASGATVALSAYNHAQRRDNLINQTDVTTRVAAGGLTHELLGGVELSRQRSTDLRNTGYFGGTATALTVPFDQPAVTSPVAFRQSATDNDNNSVATNGAVYAQDQVRLGLMWQAVIGARVEQFGVRFHNNRTAADLARDDRLVSPRAALIFKPSTPVSLYGMVSVSHLPSSGDQFSSLTVTTQTLEPEHFHTYELGTKWDVRDALALTAAVYRVDRSNSQAPDPNVAGRIVQTGSRRTNGVEFGASGDVTPRLSVMAGYAVQQAWLTTTTTAAGAGASVQLVPHYTASLWSRYAVTERLALGGGVVSQAKSYAAIDNAVLLPAFTRTDVAAYVRLTAGLRAQLNVENLFDVRYYPTSQGNNNIMPGAPRTVQLSVVAGHGDGL